MQRNHFSLVQLLFAVQSIYDYVYIRVCPEIEELLSAVTFKLTVPWELVQKDTSSSLLGYPESFRPACSQCEIGNFQTLDFFFGPLSAFRCSRVPISCCRIWICRCVFCRWKYFIWDDTSDSSIEKWCKFLAWMWWWVAGLRKWCGFACMANDISVFNMWPPQHHRGHLLTRTYHSNARYQEKFRCHDFRRSNFR